MPWKDGQKLEMLAFWPLCVMQSYSLEIYVWIYENRVKTKSSVFCSIAYSVNLIFFFAFAMTADCNSYLAWNVENFLPHVSLIFFFFNYLSYPPPPPFEFLLALVQASLVWIQFARSLTLSWSRSISALYLLSKGSLPEDIIKSNEGASLTIC